MTGPQPALVGVLGIEEWAPKLFWVAEGWLPGQGTWPWARQLFFWLRLSRREAESWGLAAGGTSRSWPNNAFLPEGGSVWHITASTAWQPLNLNPSLWVVPQAQNFLPLGMPGILLSDYINVRLNRFLYFFSFLFFLIVVKYIKSSRHDH